MKQDNGSVKKTVFFEKEQPYICMSGSNQNQVSQLKSMVSRNQTVIGQSQNYQHSRTMPKQKQQLSKRLLEAKQKLEQRESALDIKLSNQQSYDKQNKFLSMQPSKRFLALRKLSREKSQRLKSVHRNAERLLKLEILKQDQIIQDNIRDTIQIRNLLVQQKMASQYKNVENILSKERQENIKKIFNKSNQMRVSANQDIILTLKNLNEEQEEYRQLQERVKRIKEMSRIKASIILIRQGIESKDQIKRSRTAQGNYSRLEKTNSSSQQSRGISRIQKNKEYINNTCQGSDEKENLSNIYFNNTSQCDSNEDLDQADIQMKIKAIFIDSNRNNKSQECTRQRPYTNNEYINMKNSSGFKTDGNFMTQKLSLNQTFTDLKTNNTNSKSPIKKDILTNSFNINYDLNSASSFNQEPLLPFNSIDQKYNIELKIKQNALWKQKIEISQKIVVLDRPIDRELRDQYSSLVLKQVRAPFKNFQGGGQYSRQKIQFLFNHSQSKNGTNATRESQVPLFNFYDTSRSKSRGGDMKINQFL